MDGKLIIICAPSGSGKSTIIKKIKKKFPQLIESISTTTRRRRKGEKNGVDYFFVDEDTFEKEKKQGEFIEWARVHSHNYGTRKEFIERELSRGSFVLCDVDIQGSDSFKKIYRDRAKVIFLRPPSVAELEKRLRNRGTETEKSLVLRLENAKKEMKRAGDFDYLVINDDLKKAVLQVSAIIESIIKGNS
jgi:guanylate kinase